MSPHIILDYIYPHEISEYTRNLLHLVNVIFLISTGFFFCKSYKINLSSPSESIKVYKLEILLILAILIGGGLRFYGLDFGLPNVYHPDEFEEAEFLTNMIKNNSIDPHYNQQPALILYLSWPISLLLKLFGFTFDNLLTRNVFSGRLVNAIMGTTTIYLVYLIAKKIFNQRTAIIAAWIIAVIPLHVTNSRYMKQDVLFSTLILTCVYYCLKYMDTKSSKFIIIAGLFGGFAMGSKYTGITSIGIILSTAWLFSDKVKLIPDFEALKKSFYGVIMVVVGFFMCVPYSLMDEKHFISLMNGIKFEARHASNGHLGLAIDPWSQLWMFHVSRSLFPGMESLPMIFTLLGIGLILYSWKPKSLWILAIALMFFLPAEAALSKPPPQPDRYVTVCTPFLAIISAYFLHYLTNVYSNKLIQALIIMTIIQPLVRTALLASEIRIDTRRQMQIWMSDNLPPNSKILLSGGYLFKVNPKFKSVSARKFIKKDKSTVVEDLKGSGYDYLLTSSLSGKRFNIENMSQENTRALEIRNAFKKIEENFPVEKQIKPKWGSYGFHNPTFTLYKISQ